MLFSDPNLGIGFRARWFAWVDPAQMMLAYAALCSEHDPNIELRALAVPTDHGGSAVPARDAGVRHYDDCSLMVSPIPADAPAASLDETHVHRLESLDRGEYARVTGAAGQGTPDRSEAWATSLAAVRTAIGVGLDAVRFLRTAGDPSRHVGAGERRGRHPLRAGLPQPGPLHGATRHVAGRRPPARRDRLHGKANHRRGKSVAHGKWLGETPMADKIDLNPPGVTQAAQSIAASLTRAAQPGPLPVATGASPIDGAAASVAGGVAAKVAASAAGIKEVPRRHGAGQPPAGRRRVSGAGGDGRSGSVGSLG
jgi:hypothetical protein